MKRQTTALLLTALVGLIPACRRGRRPPPRRAASRSHRDDGAA